MNHALHSPFYHGIDPTTGIRMQTNVPGFGDTTVFLIGSVLMLLGYGYVLYRMYKHSRRFPRPYVKGAAGAMFGFLALAGSFFMNAFGAPWLMMWFEHFVAGGDVGPAVYSSYMDVFSAFPTWTQPYGIAGLGKVLMWIFYPMGYIVVTWSALRLIHYLVAGPAVRNWSVK